MAGATDREPRRQHQREHAPEPSVVSTTLSNMLSNIVRHRFHSLHRDFRFCNQTTATPAGPTLKAAHPLLDADRTPKLTVRSKIRQPPQRTQNLIGPRVRVARSQPLGKSGSTLRTSIRSVVNEFS